MKNFSLTLTQKKKHIFALIPTFNATSVAEAIHCIEKYKVKPQCIISSTGEVLNVPAPEKSVAGNDFDLDKCR